MAEQPVTSATTIAARATEAASRDTEAEYFAMLNSDIGRSMAVGGGRGCTEVAGRASKALSRRIAGDGATIGVNSNRLTDASRAAATGVVGSACFGSNKV